jgi:hypothetical protein
MKKQKTGTTKILFKNFYARREGSAPADLSRGLEEVQGSGRIVILM